MAQRLLHTDRWWLAAVGAPPITFGALGTLRLLLVKTGGWVREEADAGQVAIGQQSPG